MSRIPLADANDLPPFLKQMHDGAKAQDWSTRHCARAFASYPELLEKYLTFYYPLHSNTDCGVIEPRLKELVRLRIATLNGCVTCKSARLDSEHVTEEEAAHGVDAQGCEAFSPRERAALDFAELMALDHHSFSDETMRDLRAQFSEIELLELMMMIGQYIGFGRMLAMLQLEETSCSI